tara:strand:- start:193 stop:387 length:195 start_codon:yes stop_codon:yes gene_type:complete
MTQSIYETTTLDGLGFLCEVYQDYCKKHSLPLVSADEQDWNELTPSQRVWIQQFQLLWDAEQDK